MAARLALLQLPAGVRAKVDDGQIGVGEATELLKLRHHPELLAEVAQALIDDELDDVRWAVRQALAQIERQARRGAVAAELNEQGVTVVEHDGYGVPQGLSELGGYRGLELDAEAHASEECHVVVVTSDGECRPACAEPIRHTMKGASDLKVPKRARVVSEHEAAQRAEQKAVRESAQARAEFLRELLGRRLPKASVIGLVLQAFIRSANQLPAKAACDLLDLEERAAERQRWRERRGRVRPDRRPARQRRRGARLGPRRRRAGGRRAGLRAGQGGGCFGARPFVALPRGRPRLGRPGGG